MKSTTVSRQIDKPIILYELDKKLYAKLEFEYMIPFEIRIKYESPFDINRRKFRDLMDDSGMKKENEQDLYSCSIDKYDEIMKEITKLQKNIVPVMRSGFI